MDRFVKNIKIKESLHKTKMKRQRQTCKVITVKVQNNKLNKLQKECLKMMFVEAKWVYNYCLSQDIFKVVSKELIEVKHYDKDRNEIITKLQYIGSSVKDSVIDEMKHSIRGLSVLKNKGYKVGELKFKSNYTSLNFKQYGTTHKIVDKHRIRLQGIKKALYVNGLKQLGVYSDYDIANFKLIKQNDSYYIAITIFIDNEKLKQLKNKDVKNKEEVIGVDCGCQTTLSLSNGEKINVSIEETERLKRLQRKMQKQEKGSNNRRRTKFKLDKEYTKITNRKNDIANKTVYYLLDNWENISMQDEQLKSWKQLGHGKKVQHSVLGRVKSILIKQPNIFVINKYVPTTKICLNCGYVFEDLKLSDREVICPICGTAEDRDVHAAKNMVWYFKNKDFVAVECSDFKRAEFDNAMYQLFGNSYKAPKQRNTKIQLL
jgi:putative transposase